MTRIPDKEPVNVPAGRIEMEMTNRDSMLWGKVGLKLAVGLPLMLIVPFVGATFVAFWLWGAAFNSWFLWFFLIGGGWGWLAYRYLRTHHEQSVFAEGMIREIGGDEDYWRASSGGEWEMKRQTAGAYAFLEFILFGPREVLEAWELIRERRQFAASAHQRSVEVVQYLLKFDRGVPWLELLHKGENITDLLHVLGYLRLTDWIDISSDKKKVWLLSQARRAVLAV